MRKTLWNRFLAEVACVTPVENSGRATQPPQLSSQHETHQGFVEGRGGPKNKGLALDLPTSSLVEAERLLEILAGPDQS